jgi:dTDP-4-dehydrorhamnose reductase
MRINGDAAGAVAAAAARAGALILQISTNEVFDGTLDRPYREDDTPNPINPYGASKLRGEQLVAEANARHLIVRTAWLFGPDGQNFVTKIMAAAIRSHGARLPLRVVNDESGNPTWAPFAAQDVFELSRRAPLGVYHSAGEPPTSRFGWARTFLDAAVEIQPVSSAEFERASRVPPRAVLSTTKACSLGIPGREWEAASRGLAGALGSHMIRGDVRIS